MQFYKVNYLNLKKLFLFKQKEQMKKYKEERPWGKFEQFTLNEISTVKILTIKAGKRFSLQYHKNRKEFWRFLDNPAKVTLGKKTFIAKKGDEFIIDKKTNHRIESLGKDVHVLEISFGKFDEKDIIRVDDDFGRVKIK